MHTTYDFNGCALALDKREAERARKIARTEVRTELELRAYRLVTRVREFERNAGRCLNAAVRSKGIHRAEYNDRAVRFQKLADRMSTRLYRTLREMAS